MIFIGALAFDWQHLTHTEVPFPFQRKPDTNIFKQWTFLSWLANLVQPSLYVNMLAKPCDFSTKQYKRYECALFGAGTGLLV